MLVIINKLGKSKIKLYLCVKPINMKSMMLIRHTQRTQEGTEAGTTFRMIPITKDAPYLICEYDLGTSKLVMCSDTVCEDLQIIPHIGKDGMPVPLKSPKGQYIYEVERRLIPNLFETHVEDIDSIVEMVNLIAINADSFNFRALLNIPFDLNAKTELVVSENYDAKTKKSKVIQLS